MSMSPASIRSSTHRWIAAVPIATTVLLVAAEGSSAPVHAQQTDLQEFGGYVARAVEDWEVPGLAVAVVAGGRLVFAEGYGVKEHGRSEPVDSETLFAIGSTTKAMTAAAIGMLVEEDKLAWDAPVIDYMPGLRLHDPYVTRELTVRDLLTHRAGLGNADYLWYGQDNSTAEILRRLRFVEPAYSMRSRFIYQNLMYAAAGELIATVSGMPWADFIQRRIFDPLEMDGSVPTAATLDNQPNVARPHYLIDGEIRVVENASVDAVAAAGSAWSSVADMSKWLRFLLAGGVTPAGQRLLGEGTVAELFEPQTIVGSDGFYPTARLTRPHWTTYGLGWFQQDYAGEKVDFHTGSIDGMVAIAGLLRARDVGVYALANLDHAEVRHALMLRVFDIYLERPLRDWSADLRELYSDIAARAEEARGRGENDRIEGTSPSLDLEAYAGTYTDRLYGTVEVSHGDGGLRLLHGPGLEGGLEHWSQDTFRVRWDAFWRGTALVTFTIDARGRAVELVLGGRRFRRTQEKPDV